MRTIAYVPAGAREFIIPVDSYEGCFRGSIYHRLRPGGIPFSGTADLAVHIEDLLDIESGPGVRQNKPLELMAIPSGRLGTFRLEVLFQQHNSWQGKLLWQETGREYLFQSFLELVLILHELLKQN